jgi:hypothetical protein
VINVLSASSIFEIMFGLNAAYAYVIFKYSENKQKVYTHIRSQLEQVGKYREEIGEEFLEESSYKTYPNFKRLNTVFLQIGLCFALLGTITPISLLIWASVNGNAQIHNWIFYLVLFLFLFLAPLFYYSYHVLSNKLIKIICSSKLTTPELELIIIDADLYSFKHSSKKEMADLFAKMLWHSVRRKKRKFVQFFTQRINPIYRYRQWKLDKLIKQMEEEQKQSTSPDSKDNPVG